MKITQVVGILNHFGTLDVGGGCTALYASADHKTVVSIQPDGSLQTRANAGGSYEFFQVSGTAGAVQPGGPGNNATYTFLLAPVDKLV